MPADRPLRNLTRDRLIDLYTALQSEAGGGKKYNLRKELQTDKRENVVYANRWVTHDQYLELARQEILARGLELPASPSAAAPAPAAPQPSPLAAGSDPLP